MQVFRKLDEATSLRGCTVAIGNFDGVHLGHRRLFDVALAGARARGGAAAALTFDPHPVRVLRPQLAPPLLTPLKRKLELMAGCGLDATVVQPFDLDYARSDAAEFVERDLAGALGAVEVVVGPDFTAGKGRTRVDALRAILAARSIQLTVVDPVAWDGLVVSSTKIRELLLEGNVEAAAQLLGRPHDVDGTIERGAGKGRDLGFATANLRPEGMLPANGVYAVRCRLGPPRSVTPRAPFHGWYDGVCNVGVKPTVQRSGPVLAESHLFDFEGRDLHGEALRMVFVARLREERRFRSLDELREQIALDVEQGRALLRDPT